MKIGILDETHPLKTAGYWPPGLETLIGQTLPSEISLFYESFDVLAAQKEHKNLINLLNHLGVKTINFRDTYVETIKPVDLKPEIFQKILVKQCEKYMKMYGTKIDTRLIEELLYQDIKRYGEEKAAALNLELCIGLPLCNITFSRDQGTVILDKCFLARPTYPVRKPEIPIIKKTLRHLGMKPIEIPDGTFEGGDAIVHRGHVLFGKGMRTDDIGAINMLRTVRDWVYPWYLKPFYPFHYEYDFLIVEMTEEMHTMHLDTIFMPFDYHTVVDCPNVTSVCNVTHFPTIQKYSNFHNYLKTHYDCDIITVSRKEQQLDTSRGVVGLATNFLNADKYRNLNVYKRRKVVPLRGNEILNQKLEDNGAKLYFADIYNLIRMWGGPHCLLYQLLRGY